MVKLYDLITWHNNTTPALNETNLNAMSEAINNIDDRVIDIADLLVVVVPQIQAAIVEVRELAEDCEENAQDAEAWAVGQRNGQDVPSSDPTYHNNSKWYSEHLQTDLGNLNDVELTDVQDGDSLIRQGNKWVNGQADIGLFVQNGILMCRYETA